MDSRLDSTSGATPARRLVVIPLQLISTSPTLGYLEMFFDLGLDIAELLSSEQIDM